MCRQVVAIVPSSFGPESASPLRMVRTSAKITRILTSKSLLLKIYCRFCCRSFAYALSDRCCCLFYAMVLARKLFPSSTRVDIHLEGNSRCYFSILYVQCWTHTSSWNKPGHTHRVCEHQRLFNKRDAKRTFVHYSKARQHFKEAHHRLQLIAAKSIDFKLKKAQKTIRAARLRLISIEITRRRLGDRRVKCCIWFRDWMQLKGTPNGIDTKYILSSAQTIVRAH